MTKVLLLLSLLFALSTLLEAQKFYQIRQYQWNIQYLTTRPCWVRVNETITYDFIGGTFTGAARDISTKGFRGYPSTIYLITVISPDVTVSNIQPSQSGNLWTVTWSFPPTQSTVRFTIIYEADLIFESSGKNYFDYYLVDGGWPVDLRDLSAQLGVPAPIYSPIPPPYTVDNNTVVWTTTRSIVSSGLRWEWVVQFDKKYSCRTGVTITFPNWAIGAIIGGVVFIVLVAVFVCRRVRTGGYSSFVSYGNTGTQYGGYHHHHHHHHHSSSHHHSGGGGGGGGGGARGGGSAW